MPERVKPSAWMKVGSVMLASVFLGMLVFTIIGTPESGGNWIYRSRWLARKLHVKIPPPSPLTVAERAAVEVEAAAWKAKFQAEFPVLDSTPRSIIPEDNGFLLLWEFPGKTEVSEEFANVLRNPATCDQETGNRLLAEHSGLVMQAERIGSRRTRSSSGMPKGYNGFIPAVAVKRCGEILLLKACLAVKAGDEGEALRCVSACGNIADHLHDIEAPTLLSETVAILTDASKRDIVLANMLPAFGKSADLIRWKTELERKEYSTREFARLLRGEWEISADFMMFPLIATCRRQNLMPDAEAVARFHSLWVSDTVTKLPSSGLADLEAVLASPAVSGFSEEGSGVLKAMHVGLRTWSNGYRLQAVKSAQALAIVDLLIKEKAGIVLTDADAERVTRNPLTGEAFVYNAAKREISEKGVTDDPLVLPW